VISAKLSTKRAEREKCKRKLEKQERRIVELDNIIQRLYEDKISGTLSADRFIKLSAGYEKEQAELNKSTAELRAILTEEETETVNIESFLRAVKKYTEPTELTPALLHEFVDKIVIHEASKSSGHRVQQIDVHYNFIGEIELSPEYRTFGRKPRS
ncbi:MAG: DUF4368 domain-containing protein, partial [Oscillospiraceae bacterium]|nr:DUF4368 domain-containing protein [Oscillospiraceae bacterium]